MKTNKYEYYKVIQQNCGCGWDDVSFYPTNSQFEIIDNKSGVFFINKYGKQQERKLINYDLEEYRMMGYPLRVIKRKELKEQNN